MLPVKNQFLSEKSILYRHLAEAPTESVGSITLPAIPLEKIVETLGEKKTFGGNGTIYQVKDSNRVYKAIPKTNWANGNEVLISKIASDLGVAPTFYSAFLVTQPERKPCVMIEMDDAGKSLGNWMEDLAEEIPEKEDEIPEDEIPEEFKQILAQSKYNHLVLIEVPKKKRLNDYEEAVDKMYPNREIFYYELFSKIQILAQNKIVYHDTHVGNIMPNLKTEKGMQLVDFGSAEISSDPRTAAESTIQSRYNQALYKRFKALPNLSDRSKELIAWFKLMPAAQS